MKKYHITAILFFVIIVLNIIFGNQVKVIYINSESELEKIFQTPQKNIEIHMKSGNYNLISKRIIDLTCGNCEDMNQNVPATAGLIITGKNIKIVGPKDKTAVIYTNSGYGIFIKDCKNCVLEDLFITGGIRDTSAFATDAAVVVKNSNAIIRNNVITENFGDSLLIAENIVGIMGICGRENSRIEIIGNKILRNSWDGIALYRDAEAIIEENIIDGIDKAGGRIPRGGRGVGIGVTWNAKARIKNNLIKRYWKGIGLFVNADAEVKGNIIEDITAWGISLWDAGKGEPKGLISNNIIYKCGAMGASITSKTEKKPGCFTDNIIIHTAQDPTYDSSDYYGYQCALAKHSIPEKFTIENNLFYDNHRADKDFPDYDIPLDEFQKELKLKKEWIKKITVLEKSDFYKKFIE
ncbi:MAG: right-handed parallel beta-helix repeat-containing protein [Candidatus Cloacimonetes bacterium]|nr:right-handed parallel beta-helix repeat-containing protein [Candidatus Cloacimonadota bacterium]